MNQIGRIICYGSCWAPADRWHLAKHHGINRLYYIHSGEGGYIHNGKTYSFEEGYLYYIPYFADFVPFCSKERPVFHTFIDFELIPPVISKQILKLNADENETVFTAAALFALGGKKYNTFSFHIAEAQKEKPFWQLCSANILYLISELTKSNGIAPLEDVLIIKALEIMHSHLKDNITIREIAMQCHINEDSFIRRFSKVIGTTPYAYLKNLRIRTALTLRDNGISLAEIAQETGYCDASSLSHALRQYE